MTHSISNCKRDFQAPCHAYLFENLLSKWAKYGISSEHGNSAENLTQDWQVNPMGRVRLLSQCRQLYTYSHAYLASQDEQWLNLLKPLYEFILSNYLFEDDKVQRWRFSLDDELQPLDNSSDAYALAFVLLSFSFYYQASQDESALIHIKHTHGFLTQFMRADTGGFYETYPIDKTQQRRQNPHMHLLEGYIAAYNATLEDVYKEEIIKLLDLAELHFFDANSNSLIEFFTPDWQADKIDGHKIEPGHHFEWVWLLHQAYKIHPQQNYLTMATRLWHKAFEFGFDPKGGIYNQIHAQTEKPLDTSKRIWPITEFLKAACVQLQNEDQAETIHKALNFMFEHYLNEDGRWHEYLDGENKVIDANLSGTTSYHIFLGLTEVLDWMQS